MRHVRQSGPRLKGIQEEFGRVSQFNLIWHVRAQSFVSPIVFRHGWVYAIELMSKLW